MKRISGYGWRSALLFCAAWALLSSFSLDPPHQEESQVSLELSYRALLPGEIVKVSIFSQSSADRVRLRFQNQGFPAADIKEGKEFLAFIGLDLNMNPGSYPLVATLLYEDGHQQRLQKEIVVGTLDFPVKKLWVDEKFVTPPVEVHERIRREAELIQAVYEMFSSQWRGEGDFIIPVDDDIVPNFGEKRIFNNQPRSAHSGIDISSPYGKPVQASNTGKVVLANALYYSGKTVILDHGLGVFSVYCHFSEISVNLGDLVSKGTVIGKVGATGRVTGPHLHWAVRVLEKRVDPLSLLNLVSR